MIEINNKEYKIRLLFLIIFYYFYYFLIKFIFIYLQMISLNKFQIFLVSKFSKCNRFLFPKKISFFNFSIKNIKDINTLNEIKNNNKMEKEIKTKENNRKKVKKIN